MVVPSRGTSAPTCREQLVLGRSWRRVTPAAAVGCSRTGTPPLFLPFLPPVCAFVQLGMRLTLILSHVSVTRAYI